MGLVGHRRRTTYAVVSIFQKKKGTTSTSCSIPYNVANNLRVREGGAIKVVPLQEKGAVGKAMEEERSGDMLLLCRSVPLRFPELWTTAGVDTPKGVLLHGPPGCGKTLIANALVEETGAHVVVIN